MGAVTTSADRHRVAQARNRKAGRLATVARSHGITAEQAAHLDAEGRAALAGLTHVPVPSSDTWVLVVAKLRGEDQ